MRNVILIKENDGQAKIYLRCPCCGEIHSITISSEAKAELASENRRSIQEILPNYTAQQRDQIVLGWCKNCWNNFYGEGEEETITFKEWLKDINQDELMDITFKSISGKETYLFCSIRDAKDLPNEWLNAKVTKGEKIDVEDTYMVNLEQQ